MLSLWIRKRFKNISICCRVVDVESWNNSIELIWLSTDCSLTNHRKIVVTQTAFSISSISLTVLFFFEHTQKNHWVKPIAFSRVLTGNLVGHALCRWRRATGFTQRRCNIIRLCGINARGKRWLWDSDDYAGVLSRVEAFCIIEELKGSQFVFA